MTDRLAGAFLAGAAQAGAETATAPLRDCSIAPCNGCGACALPPHACALAAPGDDAEKIFSLIGSCQLLVVASPIYFYHIPAHFKALVDRGQRFYARGRPETANVKPVIVLLAAGRKKGDRLFDGALLSLRWFFRAMGAEIVEQRVWRGLDSHEDLDARPDIALELQALGRLYGSGSSRMPGQ